MTKGITVIELFVFLGGILVGLALAAGTVVAVARTRMVQAHTSHRTFEETCNTLERVVDEAGGWSLPLGSWDAHAVLQGKGLVPANLVNLKFYFLCNAGHASRLLGAVPSLAGMLPCSWAIYELADGQVKVSSMNVGLMSRIFGGVPGQVMGQVAKADRGFMDEILG